MRKMKMGGYYWVEIDRTVLRKPVEKGRELSISLYHRVDDCPLQYYRVVLDLEFGDRVLDTFGDVGEAFNYYYKVADAIKVYEIEGEEL